MDSVSEIQSYAPQPPTTTGNGGGEETNKWGTTTTARTLPNSLPISAAGADSSNKKLTLIPLIFLIYFEVAGGPFGEEPAVKAAGPLCAILGFLIFPFVWSVPEALITAELSTAFPSDGGFTIWATQAFGPFWGSLMGLSKFFSGVINTASFPVLAVDYLQNVFPVFAAGTPRHLALVVFSLVLSFLNYTGLSIVGYASVCLGLVSLFPFVVLSLAAIPKVRPRRWLSWGNPHKDWNLFFNTLFWNLNFWDNVSTLAGEVREPQRTFPRALVVAVIFTCAAYLVPLLAATGSISAAAVPQDRWVTGFFAEIAEMIVGKWVKYWIEIGAVLSVVGLFEAQLSSCAFGLLGMADMGFLPAFFALRSRFDTPWVGILLSAAISVGASYLDFDDIISSANFLYSLGMLLEFASFVWLRVKMPGVERPYRIPLGPKVLSLLLLVPSAFLVYIMVIATKVVFLVSGIMMVAVVAITFLMRFCKSKGCLSFSDAKIES